MNTPNSTTAIGRETSLNYERPYRPALISLINRAAAFTGLKHPSLDPASLMRAARKKSGLDDFGENDFIHRMKLLTESIEAEAGLSFTGAFMVRQNIIRMLTNRLRMQRDMNDNPGITGTPMADPVFIIGLQRTGTTALQRMISSDTGNFRHLASWEAISPAPVPGSPPEDRSRDPRIATAAVGRRALQYLAPDFFAIHPVQELDPEEDCLLFDYDFWSTVPEATMRVPAFSRWLESQDHTPAYRYYKNVLAYLYWQHPRGRWILKTPQHMEHMDELFTVFPRAMVIQTHRDPVKVIASFCSMISHAFGIFSDRVDPREIGRHWSAKAVMMVKRSMMIREKIGADRFIDVAYRDIVHRPAATLEKVYARLGLPFGDTDRERLDQWAADNPQHKYGRHRYRAEDFGLDVGRLRKAFAPYVSQFSIPEENDV